MDTLKSMQVFRAIVEQGSFTKAADVLDISTPMTSKHLSNLENHLQAKLLHRNNRQQSLTEVGKRYYQECCYALDTLEKAKIEAQQGTIEPQGTLKIAAPVWFANAFCANLFAEFSAKYPKIQLSLYLENRFSDLIASGFDVALRVTNNPQDNLIAKPLTVIPFIYVASPQYLQQHGTPENHEELNQHIGILPNYVTIDTPLPTTHTSSNTVMLSEMAKAGMGIAILPEWLITDAVQRGELVQLSAFGDLFPTLYAAYMNRTFLSVKVRCFLDFLDEKFKQTPPRKNKP